MSEKQALLIGLLIIIVFQIANLQLAHLIFQKLFNIKTKTLNLMLNLKFLYLLLKDLGYCRLRKISFSCFFIL